MAVPRRRLGLFLCVLASPSMADAAQRAPSQLDRVLLAARENRLELEAALNHYSVETQPLEHAAMEWLILHLERHGHARMAWFDARGRRVELPVDAFASDARRQALWAELEETRGPLRPGLVRFDADVLSLRQDELVATVDFAVRAWRERPWTRGLEFEAFCAYVLPHRVGNEALHDWRRVLFETFEGLPEQLEDAHDPRAAAAWIRRSVRDWVEHGPAYCFHLTDQTLDEMLAARQGRGEDLAHLEVMALRANAVPAALDYTPAWAARRGNAAWTRLMLPAEGDGAAPPATEAPHGRLAKVYRRSYAATERAWEARLPAEEHLPTWLADPGQQDVTAAYTNVADVTVDLDASRRRSGLAYVCVFDGEAWTPIAAGEVSDEGSAAHFTQLGCEVVYLPAWFDRDGVHPAAPPFVLTASGSVRVLQGLGFESPGALASNDRSAPAQPQELHQPAEEVRWLPADETVGLLQWRDHRWVPVQTRRVRDGGVVWELEPRRLYWIQPVIGLDRSARPFSARGSQLFWR